MPPIIVLCEARQGIPPCVQVLWVHQMGLAAERFRQRTGGGRDDRASAGHHFQGRQAEALVKRGINKASGTVVNRRQMPLANVTDVYDSPGTGFLADEA